MANGSTGEAGSSFPGGKAGKIVAVVVLAAAVVVAIVMSLREGVTPKRPPGFEGVNFLCTKCQHAWMVPKKELPDPIPDDRPLPPRDCPKCGQKASAYSAIKCPNPQCNKFYVSQYALGNKGVPDICPACGVNPMEWNLKPKK